MYYLYYAVKHPTTEEFQYIPLLRSENLKLLEDFPPSFGKIIASDEIEVMPDAFFFCIDDDDYIYFYAGDQEIVEDFMAKNFVKGAINQ